MRRSALLLHEADEALRRLERAHRASPQDAELHGRYVNSLRRAGKHEQANIMELHSEVRSLHGAHNEMVAGARIGVSGHLSKQHEHAINFRNALLGLRDRAQDLLGHHSDDYERATRYGPHSPAEGYDGSSGPRLVNRLASRALDPKQSNPKHFVSLLAQLNGSRHHQFGKTYNRFLFYRPTDGNHSNAVSVQDYKNALDYHKIGRVVEHGHRKRHMPWMDTHRVITSHSEHGKHADLQVMTGTTERWTQSKYNQESTAVRSALLLHEADEALRKLERAHRARPEDEDLRSQYIHRLRRAGKHGEANIMDLRRASRAHVEAGVKVNQAGAALAFMHPKHRDTLEHDDRNRAWRESREDRASAEKRLLTAAHRVHQDGENPLLHLHGPRQPSKHHEQRAHIRGMFDIIRHTHGMRALLPYTHNRSTRYQFLGGHEALGSLRRGRTNRAAQAFAAGITHHHPDLDVDPPDPDLRHMHHGTVFYKKKER